MGKIARSWEMVKASWLVLQKDKELLLFSFISLICCLLVSAGFFLAIKPAFLPQSELGAQLRAGGGRFYLLLFFFYFVLYLIGTYFSTAVAACAVIRLRGGDPTVRDGIRVATQRLPVIIGWSLFAATVGIVLRILEDRSKLLARIVTGIMGIAFSLASFLVIPVLAVEGVGPLNAFRRSAEMLKKTWGEQLSGNIGIGLIAFLLSLPAIVFLLPAFSSRSMTLLLIGVALAIFYLLLVNLVMKTLQTIFQAAVYLYARSGLIPAGYDAEMIKGAIVSEEKKDF